MATPEMAAYCFKSLLCHLHKTSFPQAKWENYIVNGLFVTWEDSESLRGCIGCLSPLRLNKLSEYAIRSSQEDNRFTPIGISDVETLTCTVSILHSFEPCVHPEDWTVGTHGIVCKFSPNHNATFLPHVMTEQRWDRNAAITAAARKCGFRGNTESVQITKYQSSKQSLSHTEYIQHWC